MMSKLLRGFLLVSLLSFICIHVNAQSINDYIVQEYSGTFATNTAPAGTVNPAGDEGQLNFNMPFTFTWDNTVITYVHMNSNGFISLNYNWETSPNNPYFGGPAPGAQPMILSWVGADMGTNGLMSVQMYGSSPNRIIVCEWNSINFYYNSGSCTFQIKFYEGSNIIEFVSGGFTLTGTGKLYASGASAANYINIQPGNPSTIYRNNNTGSYVSSTYVSFLPVGKTYRLLGLPLLTDVTPRNGDILMKGGHYTQTQTPQFCPSVYVQRVTGQPDVFIRYKIGRNVSPTSEDYQIIYTAVNEVNQTDELVNLNPQPNGSPARAFFTEANGIASENPDNGGLDLQTLMNQIPGGEYFVDAQLEIPSLNYVNTYPRQLFNIALANDLVAASFLSPRQNNVVKYPTSTRVPVIVEYRNTGFNAVSQFTATVNIYYQNETTPQYTRTLTWTASGIDPALTTGVSKALTFDEYLPNRGVGSYRVETSVTLNNPTPDQDLTNNILPRNGSTYFFDVAYDLELQAYNIYTPSETVSLGRPILPQGQIRNLGISDIPYQVPASIVIYKINDDGSQTKVFGDTVRLDAIPAFPSGVITNFYSSKNFTPDFAGNYLAVLTISAMDDPILENNTYSKNFTVLPGLYGTYTIGSVKPGIDVSRNYLTIEAAINDLYLKGISGPVVYEFTDKTYTVNGLSNVPAIDLSSRIIGNNSVNTIKFKPNATNSLNAGDVVITLNSQNGIGVLIGQNSAPANANAAIHTVLPALKKQYSNSMGYITFDGGNNKSLKFVLNTSSDFKAGFYLGQGASNNAVKNCIIEDASTNSDYSTIPMTRYNATNRAFEFQNNSGTHGTYSAGIVMRSIAPFDAKQFSLGKLENPNKLDTASNCNNVISGNTINGFGYGIVSLGIGVLEKVQAGIGVHTKYYNTNNTISGNTIYNVNKAGIFLGFEQNSAVSNNRIYNVFNQGGIGAAGIIAGSDPSNNYLGYNNMGVAINGNEISDVNTNVRGAGIYVTQSLNAYPKVSSSEYVNFPDAAESMLIVNNAIWGFDAQTATDSKAGIVLQTGRAANMTSPAIGTYRTRNDVIANNTVILNEDGFSSTDNQTALMLQQAANTKVVNNALANNDMTYAAGNVAPLMYYYNEMPETSNVQFDRNVYYNANNNTDLVYAQVSKADGSVENTTTDGDLRSLYQWQIVSGQDANSSVYNFNNDLTVTTTNKLRIKTSPTMPVGSKLNNNGYRFNEIKINATTSLLDKVESKDLTSTLRGVGGKRTDIGALEFDGQLRLNDIEVVGVTSPAVYKSVLGQYNDNQYVMTTAPVEIKAMIRNNGNLPENNVAVRAIVFRQWPNGSYVYNNEVIADTFDTYVNIGSNESVIADFKTAAGQGRDFIPETYSDLRTAGYVCPTKYTEMVTNVTPIYKIEISVNTITDLDNTNNVTTEQYRFYIKRAELNLLVSAENTTADKNSASLTADQLAGRLNYDSLKAGFIKLGWKQETTTEPKSYDFDVFDRTTWEPKAVNYAMYRNLFWSDGDDKAMPQQSEKDIRAFLSNSSTSYKKLLVMASQEMLRLNADKADFTNNILKSVNKAPNSPLNGASYSNNRVIGGALSIGKRETIKATGFTNALITDAEPNPALMGIVSTSQLPRPAYIFETRSAMATDSLAGVATSELDRNVIYLGIDWRHWANLDTLLRGAVDYNVRNGGIFPVELIDFDAIALNNRVELSWTTASELNTDRFEVERAILSPIGVSNFSVIAKEAAAGVSQTTRNYGPVVDRNVTNGTTYIYRLRTIDKDGASSLSDEVEVTLDGANTLGTVNPNPAQNGVNLDFTASGEVSIKIYDVNGKFVKEIYNGTANGAMNISFDVTGLSSGSYTIVMQSGKEFFSRQLFVRK